MIHLAFVWAESYCRKNPRTLRLPQNSCRLQLHCAEALSENGVSLHDICFAQGWLMRLHICWWLLLCREFIRLWNEHVWNIKWIVHPFSRDDLGGDFKDLLCSPLFKGKISNLKEHIFQIGWNHQGQASAWEVEGMRPLQTHPLQTV